MLGGRPSDGIDVPAHYWGRSLRALGHAVRLIPAAYVRPFVRRNKTDAGDAWAFSPRA
jgi:transposase